MKKGWEIKKLGAICENLDSKRIPITKHKRNEGKYPYYGASGIVDYVDDFIFDEELLLVSEDGANLLARTYPIAFSISGKTWVNNHAHVLRFSNKISQAFVEYYLNSINLDGYINGMAQPKLNQAMLNSISIPFPPAPEQKRIVSILDSAFAAIDQAKANVEKNLQNARELFESYLQGVFGDPGADWEEKELGDVVKDVQYGSSSKSKPLGKIPVLRMGNIQNRKLVWDHLVYTDDQNEIEKYLLKSNDILFNRTNSPELVGKTAIYKGEMPAIFAGYLIRIIRKEDLLDADYLNYYLNCKKIREYGFSVMTSSVNQANINGTKLKEYPIVLPPLKIQKKIASNFNALLDETQTLETLYRQKLTDLEDLKKSILQKAFAGELS